MDYLKHFLQKWDKGSADDRIAWDRWYKAFKAEEARRLGTPAPVPSKPLPEEDEETENQQFIDAVGEMDLSEDENPLPSSNKVSVTGVVNPKSNVRVVAKKTSVNDASLSLLKEFITRNDKSIGIVDWVGQLAKDALRYGEVKEIKPGKTIMYYMGKAFHYDASDPKVMTLTRIWEKKD